MKSSLHVIGVIVVLLLSLHQCKQQTEPAEPNQPPTTTLYNLPAENDTLFALVELAWDGGDEDGYIAGYEYRYTTTYIASGDSVTTDWIFTDEDVEIIAFDSKDSVNRQQFEVRAVDNTGNVDPTPAERTFYTIQTVPPEVTIETPDDGGEQFARDEVSDWWLGVQLAYSGKDEDGVIEEFAWRVDDKDWHWTRDTTLFITPSEFTPVGGEHTISVKARDNTNIEGEVAQVDISLVHPTFEKELLIIDETREEEFPSGVDLTDAEVDSFYAGMFGVELQDMWDYEFHKLRVSEVEDRVPPLDILGQYKTVLWHTDTRPASEPHEFPLHEAYLKDYLNIGGNLILSGWRVLKSFAWGESFPVEFGDSSFVNEYLHIVKADETPYFPGDFIGATAALEGFSDVAVDTTLLADAFPYEGLLSNINIITSRAGFTEVLFRYENPDDSNLFQYTGQAAGLRYTGTAFNTIVLGFPLTFIQQDDAAVLAEDILEYLRNN